jgi:hypothetical protein
VRRNFSRPKLGVIRRTPTTIPFNSNFVNAKPGGLEFQVPPLFNRKWTCELSHNPREDDDDDAALMQPSRPSRRRRRRQRRQGDTTTSAKWLDWRNKSTVATECRSNRFDQFRTTMRAARPPDPSSCPTRCFAQRGNHSASRPPPRQPRWLVQCGTHAANPIRLEQATTDPTASASAPAAAAAAAAGARQNVPAGRTIGRVDGDVRGGWGWDRDAEEIAGRT